MGAKKMRDETDNNTIDLFGDAEPQSATQQVNSLLPIDIKQPAQPDEQKARARVNSVSFDALQDQAKAYALQVASKAIKLGYKHKALFCYTDAAGQPMYFKVRHEYPNFESLSVDEQQRISKLAAAQKHKWINENTLEVKIKVMVNYELERLILSAVRYSIKNPKENILQDFAHPDIIEISKICKSVDFPAPDSPTIETTSPSRI